jgi:hypothetical protein
MPLFGQAGVHQKPSWLACLRGFAIFLPAQENKVVHRKANQRKAGKKNKTESI